MNITKLTIVLIGEIIGIILILISAYAPSAELPIQVGIVFLLFWNIAYIGGSLKQVEADELAMETFFGKPVREYEAGAGLVFVPIGFYQLKRFPSTTNQFQIPGEPEKVFKGNANETIPGTEIVEADKQPLPPGMVRPIRIFTGQEAKVDPGDPLTKRLHAVISAIIRWRIKNVGKFVKNVGNPEEAERQLRDTAEKALVEILGKKSPSNIIATIGDINSILTQVLQKLVDKNGPDDPDGWGVEIEDFQLLAPDFGHSLSKKMSNAAGAMYEKETTIQVAQGKAEAIKLEGFANAEVIAKEGVAVADARFLLLAAEAKGFKKIAKDLGITEGELILQIDAFKEAMQKAGENGHVFLNMPNFASIAEMFSSVSKTNSKP